MVHPKHKILIANRGEIALRIQRSADKLGIPTVAIYTLADAGTPIVTAAGEAHPIGDGSDPRGYLDMEAILEIASKTGATMVAPGYGFLSENAVSAVTGSYLAGADPTTGFRNQGRGGWHDFPWSHAAPDLVHGSQARGSRGREEGQRTHCTGFGRRRGEAGRGDPHRKGDRVSGHCQGIGWWWWHGHDCVQGWVPVSGSWPILMNR